MARPGDPKVGPADPSTIHRELEKRLKEEADYRKTHPMDVKETAGRVGEHDHLPQTGQNPHRELRQGPQGKTIMESVDEMARGTQNPRHAVYPYE